MAEMLIHVQQGFLESGPEKLRPFTMKQAAEYLDFKSESTISRAAASKYVRTPHGVFPFKYFFTAGYVSDEGNEVSRTADMELLKKLVDEEDKKHPLSDDKLSQLLNKAGHPVARRTVAKYRDIMNIPSSSLRKEHF
jgi:RNA polymerase sigma-54 factor